MINDSSPLSKLEKIELYALSVHARELKRQLRFVDYRQAERASVLLAERLRGLFSPSELAGFAFAPIPRGGFIVLGMLAYALNLRPDQLLTRPDQTGRPLVVVDDCALTGLRFREFLGKTAVSPIIFAHLFSARRLREGILAQEERVTACVAAHDLGERPLPAAAQSPLGSQHYWQGSTELVAFAWSEPALLTSLLSSEPSSPNWRFVSPQLCLNNRMALGVDGRPAAKPVAGVPESLLYSWADGVLLLADSASGEFFKLERLPAAMWRALAVLGHPEPALAWLQTEFETSLADVEGFWETAVAAGMLENAWRQ